MEHKKDERIVRRVESEYAEMPGLRLTAPQAERLWGLSRDACESVLASLIESGYLERGRDGQYRRTSSDPVRGVSPRPAKVETPRPSRPGRRHDAA